MHLEVNKYVYILYIYCNVILLKKQLTYLEIIYDQLCVGIQVVTVTGHIYAPLPILTLYILESVIGGEL